MPVSHRISLVAVFISISVAVLGAAIAAAVLFSDGSSTASHHPVKRPGPKVMIDKDSWDLGRANGTPRNVAGYYSAFGVKEGDKMYLPPDQRVKIW